MKLIVALAALHLGAAHICQISPMQRGGIPGGGAPEAPATHECFHNTGPCGGMDSEAPAVTLQGGADITVHLQQNLNHYSVGNPGYIEWAIAYTPDPTSDGDFQTLGTMSDYDAYHQWTQTNVTMTLKLPEKACDHAVLQARYISNKPTEPQSFYQCSDVAILAGTAAAGNKLPLERPALRGASKPKTGRAPAAATGASWPPRTYGMHDTGVLELPSEGEIVELDPVDSDNQLFVSDVAAAADSDYLYFMQGDADEPTWVDIARVDPAHGTTDVIQYNDIPYPFSGIHARTSDSSLLVVGLDRFNTTDYQFSVAALGSGGKTIWLASSSAGLAGLGPYVDYAWSQFDAVNEVMHILVRHEDEPLTIPAMVISIDIVTGAATSAAVDPSHHFSSFVVDNRGKGAGQLLAMSPGPINPDTGDCDDPSWSLVAIDTTQGPTAVATELAAAPSEANAGPVHWSGGTWGYTGTGPFLFFAAAVPDHDGVPPAGQMTKNEPKTTVALLVTPAAAGGDSTVELVDASASFYHNVITAPQE